jgi:predicted RNase H-related nuclease YkuK (DUF458 family)
MKMEIIAPDRGKIDFDTMVDEIKEYLKNKPDAKIIVGSDSQRTKNKFCFATCVAVWDPGHGGIFYIKKDYKRPHRNFGSIKSIIAWKVWSEAQDICDMMVKLIEDGIPITDKITHHDLSMAGLSGEHIQAIRGFMISMGFKPEFKPNAVIASGIANMYSKK